MKRIAIDFALISPGKAEFGGGIWTYASSLLKEFDKLDKSEFEIICFVNPDFVLDLRTIRLIRIPANINNSLLRLIWTHFVLPILCIYCRIDLLHKLATEIPFYTPTKLITTVHDLMIEFYLKDKKFTDSWTFIGKLKAKYFIAVTKHTLKRSDRLIVPDKTILNEISSDYKTNLGKIVIVNHGIDRDDRSITNYSSSNIESNKILYVSSFYPHKGHVYGVKAFAYLINNYSFKYQPAPELFFRGHIKDKDYYANTVCEIDKSGCKEKFHFEKYDSKLTISEIYKSVSVFFLLSEYEGFGIPVLEAQSFGIPVICSDIKVFRETLGDSAIFVNFRESDEVARKLFELYTSKEMKLDYSSRGLINSSKYNWPNSADITYDIYRKIIN